MQQQTIDELRVINSGTSYQKDLWLAQEKRPGIWEPKIWVRRHIASIYISNNLIGGARLIQTREKTYVRSLICCDDTISLIQEWKDDQGLVSHWEIYCEPGVQGLVKDAIQFNDLQIKPVFRKAPKYARANLLHCLNRQDIDWGSTKNFVMATAEQGQDRPEIQALIAGIRSSTKLSVHRQTKPAGVML